MAPPKGLSRLEWEVMQHIWEMEKAVSVRQVLDKAYPAGEKAYTTVQTVMNNLRDKGYLKAEKIGLVNFYAPLFPREQMVQRETRHFVERVFNGSFSSLASYLIGSENLTAGEIEDLKKLLEERHDAAD
ncbi:MAG: BlaI/MecI/CopY family transcriptional regulator [Calditrichaeota bacterium]|nr:MAG: BlaI/MecI/CopY family transcriptional regulator [Calditrichota bacterium]